jgi:hypothetical protein
MDSVTTNDRLAQQWYDRDGTVVVNYENGGSTLHTFGPLPIVGVESYQRDEPED